MLLELTHPDMDFELFIDHSEIIVMERYHRPKTTLITMNQDRPEVTAIVLRGGRTLSCKETPTQIIAMFPENAAKVNPDKKKAAK